MTRIVPVIDLLDGIVVRGVGGKREGYRPVESCLTRGAEPLRIARAFRERLGLAELYVADLDAILHERPNVSIYRTLADDGFQVMVDAGLRDLVRARETFAARARAVIAGLETSPGPEHLRELCGRFGPDRVIFSLDLQAGKPLGHREPWNTTDPIEIALQAIAVGVTRMIVLDLAQVGVSAGVSTSDICRRLLRRSPDLRLITGGGVRSVDDLRPLQSLGIEGALVATALHNGQIGRRELERLTPA